MPDGKLKREVYALKQQSGQSGDNAGSAKTLLEQVKTTLEASKALDVVTIDLAGKSDIADYMVIASGNSGRQVSTMAEKLVQIAKDHGVKGVRPEGLGQADWVLLDAGDIIVHLFRPEVRAFYNLEKMWTAEFPDVPEPAPA